MLIRKKNILGWFEIPKIDQIKLFELAKEAAYLANGMTHFNDYLALGVIALSTKPKNIFEIGTYLGVTSNFLLKLLPDVKLVSIAFINPPKFISRNRFNNSELKKSQIGSAVEVQCRSRFFQLLGDSHELSEKEIVNHYGFFDLIFIDGDHSRKGVELDTKFAETILDSEGTICWHDANPKMKYQEVQDFLENMSKVALATEASYIGGIACWSYAIEEELTRTTGEYLQ